MATAELVSTIVAVMIEFVVGIALNMHILLVYIGNLKSGHALGTSDKVHLAKAAVNVSLHVVMSTQNITYVLWPHVFLVNEVFLWITMITLSLIFYSYWLTAVLCVYYFANITTCGHPSVVWLKRSLLSYLLHVFLVSGLGSVAINIPIIWFCNINPAGNSTDHTTVVWATAVQNATYRIISVLLGCFLPSIIALFCTTITSWSLIKHIRRMKQNNCGFTRSNFQTQINATRTMFQFLLISLIYNVSQMLFCTVSFSASDVAVKIFWFIIISYPILEAIVIIQSSFKLRKTLPGKFFDMKRRNSEVEM